MLPLFVLTSSVECSGCMVKLGSCTELEQAKNMLMTYGVAGMDAHITSTVLANPLCCCYQVCTILEEALT